MVMEGAVNTVPAAWVADILREIKEPCNPYVVIENRRQAIAWAMAEAKQGDVVILCGKGHETYQILGTEVTHLDEREEVAKQLTLDNKSLPEVL